LSVCSTSDSGVDIRKGGSLVLGFRVTGGDGRGGVFIL